MAKRALVFGVTGQDGAYLARLLLDGGYEVFGVSRDREMAEARGLTRVGAAGRVTMLSASLTDFRSVLQVVSDVAPHEIYNLAGQSSVGLSFSQPIETLDSTIVGALNILESMRFLKSNARLYNACSSECFGNVEAGAADERTPFHPRSPYGVGKAAAFWATANYREAYGLFACSGILFNHESPLRPRRFVTQKIIAGAADIAEGKADSLTLGDLGVQRDFGWAPEYVDAMHCMLQIDSPHDYVIATGQTNSLEQFVAAAFETFGLDWKEHVKQDRSLLRPSDIGRSAGDPSRAAAEIGWRAETKMHGVVVKLAEAERRLRAGDQSA
jgi:GDPmannose 4,6-dehydratase